MGPCGPLAYAEALVTAVDEARAAAGVAPLLGCECLTAAALDQAASLLGSAELTPALASDLLTACSPATRAEQLLSRGAETPSGVVAQWLASEELRGRLLDPELLEDGVGCVLDRGELLCSFVLVGR
ncbi:MAG: hypothetical protein H7269_05160 [Cellulomonas sp.]|nr:hypothetical protein [Cellulomonas sp.]